MKTIVLPLAFFIPSLLLQIMLCNCHDKKPTTPSSGYNLESQGVPKFIRAHFINPGHMARISRFRSAIGTDFSDDFEQCRSMKHYFQPRADFDWSTLDIYSPVTGKIIALKTETNGSNLQIQPQDYPDFEVHIGQVKPRADLAAGTSLRSGDKIGSLVGNGILGFFTGYFFRRRLSALVSAMLAFAIQLPWLVVTDIYIVGLPWSFVGPLILALALSNALWALVAGRLSEHV